MVAGNGTRDPVPALPVSSPDTAVFFQPTSDVEWWDRPAAIRCRPPHTDGGVQWKRVSQSSQVVDYVDQIRFASSDGGFTPALKRGDKRMVVIPFQRIANFFGGSGTYFPMHGIPWSPIFDYVSLHNSMDLTASRDMITQL